MRGGSFLSVGIDRINFYVPRFYLDLRELAQARQQDPDKYTIGIGQDQMAIAPLEQDIIAMAANAAYPLLEEDDKDLIDMVLFATETSFDFSKAAAVYLHDLLGIQPYARAVEFKEACYAGTAALQMACDYVRLRPERKVLVLTSDISRYGLSSSGEVTQGAGAVAFVVSANPSILAISSQSLAYTSNQFDFWRPYYRREALVDGKFSNQLYQDIFVRLMGQFLNIDRETIAELETIHFHLPYSKMGMKALKALRDQNSDSLIQEKVDLWLERYPQTTYLGRRVGNIYTGSLYLSLISSLIYQESFEPSHKLALFSYGSGAVAELLIGELQDGYQKHLDIESMLDQLDQRQALTVAQYEQLYQESIPVTEDEFIVCQQATEPGFYLHRVDGHRRFYIFNKNKP